MSQRIKANSIRRRIWSLSLLITSLVVLTAFNLPRVAAAAGTDSGLQIESMSVQVMPEYDDPRLLVLYSGKFEGNQTFPQKVRFLIPKGVQIGMVCAVEASGNHLCQKFDKTDVGDYTAIDYTLPLPNFALEYYADQIQGQVNKTVDFKFMTPYPVKSLEVDAQQPLKATAFTTDPVPASTAQSSGFNYSLFNYTNLDSGKPVEVKLAYTKEDPKPSVEKQQTSTGSGTTGTNSGSTTSQSGPTGSASGFGPAYIVLIVVAVAIAGGMAFWMGSRRAPAYATTGKAAAKKRTAQTTAASRGAKPSSSAGHKKTKTAPAGYCRGCGEPLPADARFCRSCGAEIRED
jgi:hypothetical protein